VLFRSQGSIIKPLTPDANPGGRPRRVDMREVVNGVFYLNRTGCSWRHLPHDFPPWGTVHYYCRRFRIDGTWEHIHDKLRGRVRRKVGRTTTPTAGILDSQSIKTDAPQKRGAMVTTLARKPLDASVI